MITRKIQLVDGPNRLSADGVINLEPPCELVMRVGESTVRFDAADTCNYNWVLVGEHAGLWIVLGWEATSVLVADPHGGQVNLAGRLNRLDLSDAHDPGGMLNPAFHGIPNSDDILIEYEIGLARLDLVGRRLSWQRGFHDITESVDCISDGAVWISGEDASYGRWLSDGSFVPVS